MSRQGQGTRQTKIVTKFYAENEGWGTELDVTSRTRFFILYNFTTCALNFPIYIDVDNDELDDDEKISEIRNTDLCEGVIPVIDIIQMLAGNPFIEIDFVNQENVMKILGMIRTTYLKQQVSMLRNWS